MLCSYHDVSRCVKMKIKEYGRMMPPLVQAGREASKLLRKSRFIFTITLILALTTFYLDMFSSWYSTENMQSVSSGAVSRKMIAATKEFQAWHNDVHDGNSEDALGKDLATFALQE